MRCESRLELRALIRNYRLRNPLVDAVKMTDNIVNMQFRDTGVVCTSITVVTTMVVWAVAGAVSIVVWAVCATIHCAGPAANGLVAKIAEALAAALFYRFRDEFT